MDVEGPRGKEKDCGEDDGRRRGGDGQALLPGPNRERAARLRRRRRRARRGPSGGIRALTRQRRATWGIRPRTSARCARSRTYTASGTAAQRSSARRSTRKAPTMATPFQGTACQRLLRRAGSSSHDRRTAAQAASARIVPSDVTRRQAADQPGQRVAVLAAQRRARDARDDRRLRQVGIASRGGSGGELRDKGHHQGRDQSEARRDEGARGAVRRDQERDIERQKHGLATRSKSKPPRTTDRRASYSGTPKG